jgi:hypothetical protein
MRGWIEVHLLDRMSAGGYIVRSINAANIRWVGDDNKNRGGGAIQTVGDDFIALTKETYAELKALICLS